MATNAINTMAVFSPYRPRRPNTAYRTASNEIPASMIKIKRPMPITM